MNPSERGHTPSIIHRAAALATFLALLASITLMPSSAAAQTKYPDSWGYDWIANTFWVSSGVIKGCTTTNDPPWVNNLAATLDYTPDSINWYNTGQTVAYPQACWQRSANTGTTTHQAYVSGFGWGQLEYTWE